MASLKRATQMLTKALNDPQYTTSQHVEILKRRHQIKKLRQNLQNYERASRGFGITFDPAMVEEPVSEVSDGDSESGGDDGVCSESEQPEQPGESEDLGTTEVLYST
jgi:hypothetical protein